jgi:hypothetical protein
MTKSLSFTRQAILGFTAIRIAKMHFKKNCRSVAFTVNLEWVFGSGGD